MNIVAGMDISVIIPIYNSERYLKTCLDSVLLQDDSPSLELICIDDGSTDSSAKIVEAYADRDPRVKLVRQTNQGPGVARNKGWSLAKGEYVYFLDSDDWLGRNALGRLLGLARKEGLDQILFAAEIHVEDLDATRDASDIVRLTRMANGYEIPADIANKPMSGVDMAFALMERKRFNALGQLRLIKHDILRRNGIEYPADTIHDDEFFVAALYSVSRKVMAVQEKYFHRRFRTGSIMTSQDNVIEHLHGCLHVVSLMDEYSRSHCAEGSKEMELFRRRIYSVEQACLRYLGGTSLEKIPSKYKDGVLTILLKRRQNEQQVSKSALEVANAKIARRDEWLAAEKTKTARAEEKLAAAQVKFEAEKARVVRRDEWLTAERKKTARAEEKLAAAQAKLESEKAKVVRRDEWLTAEKAKTARVEEKLAAAQAKLESANAKVARRDEWLAAEKAKTARAEMKLGMVQAKLESANAKVARRDKWLAAAQAEAAKLEKVRHILKGGAK